MHLAVQFNHFYFRNSLPSVLIIFMCLLLHGNSVSAQTNPEGPNNIPVRATSNPATPLLGGPQLPPYHQMASFLTNAFETPEDGVVFIQDSSVCIDGVAGTQDFEPNLHAAYDYADDQLSEIVFTRISNSGDRSLFSRKQFGYENGRLSAYRYSRWDDNMNAWIDQSRELFQYTGNGRLESVVMQTWSGSSWINASRTMLTYEDARLASVTHATWQNDQWMPTQRSVAMYNVNGLPTIVEHQESEMGNWSTQVRETYHYDSGLQFFLEGYLAEELDQTGDTLKPVLREIYDYDQRGFYSGRVMQHRSDTAEWENALRDNFEYLKIGIWKSWTRQVWTGKWEDLFQRDFRLANGLQVDIEQVVDSSTTEWVDNRRRFLQFDNYGNLVRERNFEQWDPVSETWINGPATQQCQHFWSEKGTSKVAYITENQIDCRFINPYLLDSEIRCLSDAPGTEYVAVLFDQMGHKVHENTFLSGDAFSIDNYVPSGIYYLLISDHQQFLYRGKLMIGQ